MRQLGFSKLVSRMVWFILGILIFHLNKVSNSRTERAS